MSAIHLYFTIVIALGLLWFIVGLRFMYRRRVRLGRLRQDGWAAVVFGAFTVVSGGFVLNYGVVNLLAGPPSILKGLVLITVFVFLLQATGYALSEILRQIATYFRKRA